MSPSSARGEKGNYGRLGTHFVRKKSMADPVWPGKWEVRGEGGGAALGVS